MIPLEYFLILSSVLFVIGIVGVLTKKNAIIVLMSIEIMLNAANINFVAFASYNNDPLGTGYVFALFSIGIAAAEVAVGLAILLNLNRLKDTVHVGDLNTMRW
jgi:NADH:ubiquinone oxidoreductase subunit K